VTELTEEAVLALLLASDAGLAHSELAAVFVESEAADRLSEILSTLAREGFGPLELVQTAGRYRLRIGSRFNPLLSRLRQAEARPLSRAAMETLAVIAYHQPITRPEMEQWRGVSIGTPILQQLQELDWIAVVGHRETPGRPALWATTEQFLRHFGLNTLADLPKAELDLLAPECLSNS